MPGLRLTFGAVLGAFALLTAMAWLPATAVAQKSANITITSAGPDGSGNPYDLTVVADDINGVPITSMTVHFSQGANDVYDATMKPSNTSDPTSQTWVASPQIPAVDLPAGIYAMTVDASDSIPETDTGLATPNPLTVAYTSTSVSVTPSPTFVTEGSQNVTFAGTVTGTAQDGSSTQVPIAGVAVKVSDGSQVSTNGSGVFHYTAANITQSTSYDFTVAAAGDGSYPAGDSGSIPISVEQAATSLSVTPSQTSISQGSEQITFSGTVTAVPAGGGPAVAVPGATVTISGGGTGQKTTASDGTFSYVATGVTAATDFTFSVAGTNLYSSASQDVPIGTAQSTTNVSVSPSQTFVTQGATNVSFTGQVTVTPPGGGSAVPIGSGIPVQVSVGGLATAAVTTDFSGDFSYAATGITASTDFNFSVSSSSLYTAGSHDIPMPAEQAATAVSVTPSQGTIELGSQNVTFSGSVTMTPPGSTTPVSIGAGIPVTVSGGSCAQPPVTTSSGSFTCTVTGISQATNFTFSVASTSLYNAPTPAAVQITQAQAAQSIIAIATPTVITFGSPTATITGTVTGKNTDSTSAPIPGIPVFLNGGSSPVATTDSNGHFSYVTPALTASTTDAFSINADARGFFLAAATSTPVNVTAGSTGMTATANPSIVNAGPQQVTFTGVVDVIPASTGATAEPITDGLQVQVSRVRGGVTTPPVAAGTTSGGTFTYPVPDAMPGDEYDFSIAGATLYTGATADVAFGKESTTLTVTPSQSTITEGSQDVTFSGTATGMVPGGSAVPIQGAQVLLNDQPDNGLSTGSQGTFTYAVGALAKTTSYHFSINGTSTYTAATQDVSIAAVPARTRISGISVSPLKLKYGQTATLRGTVQYQRGSTWTSLGGTTVHVAEGKTSIANVKAGTNGTFSATLPSTHGFGWSATVSATTLIQQTTALGNLAIAVPLRFSTFSARLGANGQVSSSGCLVVTAPVRYGPQSSAQIQYATGSRGRWHLLGRLPLHNFDRKAKGCANPNESFFSGSIKAALDNAYYRAVFPANSSFQRAVSAVIHSWRNQTRITSFAVSPLTLKKGQTVTMTGRLWHKVGTIWETYASRRVEIIYNEKGTSFWSNLGTVTTNSNGYFRQTAAGGGGNFTAIIYAQYSGSKTDLAARSPGISVAIKQGSALAANAPAVATMQLGVMLAPAGAQAAMLGQQNLLILGIMPATIPVL